MNRPLRHLLFALLAFGLLFGWIRLLDAKRGPLPAVGRFFSPYEGFWRNAEPLRPPRGAEVRLPGLTGTVVAEFDRRGVPHLFAPDLYTAFYAQGYVTARDRLWQMDIQSRAGMGRLSEILGPGMLRFDLERRRFGMARVARASLDRMLRDSLTRVALEGYSAGVNAWIDGLRPADLPLEFKLLDYKPEPWTPLKSAVLIQNMKWTLSQSHEDVRLTRVLDSLGGGFLARYFPLRHPGSEPILPGDVFPVRDSGGGGAGEGRASSSRGSVRAGGAQAAVSDSLWPRPHPASGSNNFVIAGARTRAGTPLLANDPHLDLTLPSLWYEVQVKAGGPGGFNAYGVSIPGLPGLVIGFTRGAAWGLTNGMDDVFDWHALRLRDDAAKGAPEYLWRGRWRALRRVPDTIHVRGRDAVVDTQWWTHTGPVPVKPGEVPFGKNTPPGHALQWTALEPSNELGAFLRLLVAEDVPGFRRAIRDLHAPAQNIVFATRSDIALAHQGRIPAKREGQGRLVAGAAAAESKEWRAYIPQARLPFAQNPARGWLASANQEVTDPGYPWYLGANFYPSERAQRLHRLLFPARDVTLSDAFGFMLDSRSRHAGRALRLLLRHVPDPEARATPDTVALDSARAHALELLRGWDYRYAANASAPVLFESWWAAFYRATWDDDLRGDTIAFPRPSRAVTLSLLASDSLHPVFDDIRTPERESAGDLARAAFETALEAFHALPASARGPDGDPQWGRVRPARVPHLLRLPSLGRDGLPVDGCGECLNAQRGSHGPSWRMVVQTGHVPEALGIYPGGQSGNPGSPRYDAFVDDWAAGRAYRLLYLRWPLEIPDSTAYLLALKAR